MNDSIPQTLDKRLVTLGDLEERLSRFPHDPLVREEAGYAAVHAGRQAAELYFQACHGVQDVAPGLKGETSYSTSQVLLKDLLRQILSDDSAMHLDPIRELAIALRGDRDPLSIGVASMGASVALLGLKSFGGVFGAWQMNVLAFDSMTWREHVSFNERILGLADGVHLESAQSAATLYNLPGITYLRSGSFANIAKAYFREIVTTDDRAQQRKAFEGAQTALASIEETVSDCEQTREALFMDTKYAMETACREVIDGDGTNASEFWMVRDALEVESLVESVRQLEPCRELVDAVATSARLSGRACKSC